MNSKRLNRINIEIQKIVSASILNGLKDPRVDKINTAITDVNVTNDLSFATVYISVIGDTQKKNETIEGLRNASGYLKKEIANHLKLRHIPRLIFKIDESTEKGMYIDSILDKLNESENHE